MFIAKDLTRFKQLFVNKLKGMLSDDELGAFILVLANSQQDEYLQAALDGDIRSTFSALKNNFLAGKLKAAPDDVDVFKRLLDIDLDDLHVWHDKTIGDWQVVYNPMREMRPARASAQKLDSINQPFDESGFHFNKPFLKPEILWQGEYNGIRSRVLFNKFPFSDYHLLIVLSPEENSAQLLTEAAHRYVFSLMTEMSDVLPGFGIGYNSLAAGASVNHFHLQGFLRASVFPVEKPCWKHNGGVRDYPLEVERFSDAGSAWSYIHELTESDQAFNCLYRDSYCYIVSRKYQGSVELPEWLDGAGWIDVAGSITVSTEESFDQIDEASLTRALALLQ